MLWIERANLAGGRRSYAFVAMLSVVLAACFGSPARAGLTIITSDTFQEDAVGSLPSVPVVGLPWQLSQSVSGGLSIVSDPLLGGNALGFGLYQNTAAMPISPAMQALINTNENLKLTFQYDSIAYNGYTPLFDIEAVGNNGLPAYLFRIMPQSLPGTNQHEIYYLNPTAGLLDTGLSVASGGTQTLTISVGFLAQSSTLTVGSSSMTLPLFSCPSEIVEAQMSSTMMGSGLPSLTLGSGYPVDVNNVTLSTHAPEPAVLTLLAVGAVALVLRWAFGRSRG
jgi:hypothetical protein